ncbi:MAG: ABC transporter permease [Planctomycetota bacterium]|nr:MAG: ABC transporter permease [Planctomycetota bacterium]
MLLHILSLIRKELLAILGDPRSRVIVFVPPIVQTLVFSYAATFDLRSAPIAAMDESNSSISRDIVAAMHGSESFELVHAPDAQQRITPMIDAKEALLLIHFDEAFARRLHRGLPALPQLIVDGRNSNTALLAANDAATILERFNNQLHPAGSAAVGESTLVVRAWHNPELQSRWFIVPGVVGLLTMVVTTMLTALAVARERELGTFDQLLVTPMRPAELVIGKTIPPVLIGLLEATFIVLMAVFWFKTPLRGSLLTLLATILCFLLSAIGVGLAISSLSRTMQQGLLGAFMFLVPSVILSGFATPIANMPPIMQRLTLLNPMRYYMTALRGVFLEGSTLLNLLDQLTPMAAIGLTALVLAGWLFRARTT